MAMQNYVNWLTELAANADAIIAEGYDEYGKAVIAWPALCKEKIDCIVNYVPADGSFESISLEIPSCVEYIKENKAVQRKNDRKSGRVSRVLSGMRKDRLHLKRPSLRSSSLKERNSHLRNSSLKERNSRLRNSSLKERNSRLSNSSLKENIEKEDTGPSYKTPTTSDKTFRKSTDKSPSPTRAESTLSEAKVIPVNNFSATLTPDDATPQHNQEQYLSATVTKSQAVQRETRSSKRKSSVELCYENIKKSKANTFNTKKNQLAQKPIKTSELEKKYVTKSIGLKASENQTLQKLQKKEEIVNENLKKVFALRQQKIQESKKKREEKTQKSQMQRLKLEKEKGERLRAHIEKDSKLRNPSQNPEVIASEVGLKKAVASPMVKPVTQKKAEVIQKKVAPVQKPKNLAAPANDMNKTYSTRSSISGKEKTGTIPPSTSAPKQVKPKVISNAAPTGTPKKNESYAITPDRSSFVSYDISEIGSDDSDGDDETQSNKPIPSWAAGVRLRNALLQQHYHPLDSDGLFGNYVEPPDLAVIMGVKKKHYTKRTSSAIWNTTFT